MYRLRSWMLVLAVVGAAATGAWLLKPLFTNAGSVALQSGQLYPQAKPLAPFALLDQHGRRFDNQRLQGKWTFVFFGYTTCPDICPTTLAVFTQFYKQLPAERQHDTQMLFATIDPERDTVGQLAQYLPFFHPELLGVTGDAAATDAFARDLGVAYARVEQEGGGYLMDHSVRVFLLDPHGRRYALFAPKNAGGFVVSELLADYQQLRQ